MDKMDGICESVGRDPKRSNGVWRSWSISRTRMVARAKPFPRSPAPPADRDELMRYVEIGVFARAVLPRPCTVEGIEKLAPVLDILDRG